MKSLTLSVILTSFCVFAYAQRPAPLSSAEDSQPNFTVPMNNSWLGRFEKRQSHMVKRLGLTTEQKKSLDTLNDHYVVKRAVLQEDRTVTRRTRVDSIKVLRFRAAFNNGADDDVADFVHGDGTPTKFF